MTATTDEYADAHASVPVETPQYDREEYHPGRVANYLLDKGDGEDISISPMKLQKLVYNGYGWVRALLDERLFDEPIEAWEHGPVIPSLYHEFKHFGWAPIKGENSRSIQFHPFANEHYDPEPLRSVSGADVCEVLDFVWDVYKNFSASDLRKQTHAEQTPWWKALNPENGKTPKRGVVIDDGEIKKHFQRLLTEHINRCK